MRPVQLTSPAVRVSRRTWILLATGVAALLLLAVCLALFAIYRIWHAGSGWLEGGQANAIATMEAEGRKHLETLRPKLESTLERGHGVLSTVAPEAAQPLETVAPQVRDALDRGRDALAVAAPGTAERLQAQASELLAPLGTIADRVRVSDVPGDDIDAVPRHPAMTRTAYSIAEGRRSLRYAGPVSFDGALSFHRQPLIDAGYTERVLASSPDAFTAEYRLGKDTLVLDVTANGAAASEVRITER